MKFKAFSLIALFIVPGLLVGCETLPENSTLPENPEHRVTTFEVEIDSDPSGAVIEINDDYAGKTPLKVEIEGWETTELLSNVVPEPLLTRRPSPWLLVQAHQ